MVGYEGGLQEVSDVRGWFLLLFLLVAASLVQRHGRLQESVVVAAPARRAVFCGGKTVTTAFGSRIMRVFCSFAREERGAEQKIEAWTTLHISHHGGPCCDSPDSFCGFHILP